MLGSEGKEVFISYFYNFFIGTKVVNVNLYIPIFFTFIGFYSYKTFMNLFTITAISFVTSFEKVTLSLVFTLYVVDLLSKFSGNK
ncbi:hypothetical protein AQ505_12305 [Pedobacter sp. PACM 27299]|nr:hypothetical protein AQ505_12305 [Pedobacter sp. PACM 27299]